MRHFSKTALLFLGCAALTFGTATSSAAGVKKGDKCPVVDMKLLKKKGRFPASKKTKGKVVIVDFWASWCEPCKKELPFLESLYKKNKKKGLEIVGINVDDEPSSGKKFIKEHPVSFPLVYDKGKKHIESVKVKAMPTSFVCGRDGKVAYVHNGFHEESKGKFKRQIASLLKKKK